MPDPTRYNLRSRPNLVDSAASEPVAQVHADALSRELNFTAAATPSQSFSTHTAALESEHRHDPVNKYMQNSCGATFAGMQESLIERASRLEIGESTAGQSLLPYSQMVITPPDQKLSQDKQIERSGALAVLNDTVFSTPIDNLNSTPAPKIPCLRLYELKASASILGPIVEAAHQLHTSPVDLATRDFISTNLTKEYPKFFNQLRVCKSRSDSFNSDPVLIGLMTNLCNRAVKALECLGYVVKGDIITLQQHPIESNGDMDQASDVGSSASKASSCASQARVKLIIDRAKTEAEEKMLVEEKALKEEMFKLQRAQNEMKRDEALRLADYENQKLEMKFHAEMLHAKAADLRLKADRQANQAALEELEAYEREIPNTAIAGIRSEVEHNAVGTQYQNIAESCNTKSVHFPPSLATSRSLTGYSSIVTSLNSADQSISYVPPVSNMKLRTDYPLATEIPQHLTKSPSPYPASSSCQRNVTWADSELLNKCESSRNSAVRETKTFIQAANDSNVSSDNTQINANVDQKGNIAHSGQQIPNITLQLGGLSDLLKQSRIPQGEPQTFSGSNLEEYLPFRSSFESLIAENCYSDEQRYRFLLKYTSGEARGLVHSCHMADIGAAYREAVRQLNVRYGDPFRLAQHFLNRLHHWPVIREGNADDLMNMSLFLNRVRNMMQRGEEWSQLDGARELRELADKLPYRLRRSWAEKVCYMQSIGKMARFCHLVDIIQHEADLLATPGMSELLSHRSPSTMKGNSRSGNIVLPTTTDHMDNSEICFTSRVPDYESQTANIKSASTQTVHNTPSSSSKIECSYCSRTGHAIAQCRSFCSRSLAYKRSWVESNKLCYRCLAKNHIAKNCRVQINCSECNSTDHVKAMHRSSQELERPLLGANAVALAVNNSTQRPCKRIWSPLVPVEVISRNGRSCYTYAALDTWASSSFMSEEIAELLQEAGVPSPLNVTTVTESSLMLECSRVCGLNIRALNTVKSHPLSSLYKISHWPFDKADLPSEADWHKYSHLRSLPVSFIDSNVGLLLGQSDSELLKVLETVSGPEGEPYATRHKLGWALQGCTVSVSDVRQHCLRTAVTPASDSLATKMASRIEIGRDLESLYGAEFDDPHPNVKGGSTEDQIWEGRIRSSMCYSNGKLQIGLPFRDPNVQMPDNRDQAFRCAKHLQRRLSKDPGLLTEYTDFMQKMVVNGHLELIPRSETEGVPGRVWFLVHHPVRHKVKKKLRVVFDCSRRYGGISLNDVLLQGPDLLNRLLGVLVRFREHQIAFTGDIEQMFFQLKVPPPQSDFMRIFWWPKGDMDREPLQYRLTCHTFGAVSSPSIANYAVKEAAEVAGAFSCEARKALARGAYMDDVLCSTPSVESAKEILSVVRHSASSVGFNIRGFLSNSRDLLASLPEEILSSHCKSLDIGRDDLPSDRVLGVIWQMHEDVFSYRLNLPSCPDRTSKRSLLASLSSLFDPLGLVVPIIVPMRTLFQRVCTFGIGWDDFLSQEVETVENSTLL